MRDDQFERLQGLQAKLADVFIAEADPDGWPGAGEPLHAMDQRTRGDRYWSKKNAVATIALMQRIESLSHTVRAAAGLDAGAEADPDADGRDADVERQISHYEREAQAILDHVQRATRKAGFDRKLHGKKG